jgi:hypothetical protein
MEYVTAAVGRGVSVCEIPGVSVDVKVGVDCGDGAIVCVGLAVLLGELEIFVLAVTKVGETIEFTLVSMGRMVAIASLTAGVERLQAAVISEARKLIIEK